MPLEWEAQNYANNLFTKSMRQITDAEQEERERVMRDFAARGMLRSGPYIRRFATMGIETARKLAEAKVSALLQAYDKSGIPFDDFVMYEIIGEVSRLLNDHKQGLIGNLKHVVDQTFHGGSAPQGVLPAAANLVERGIAEANAAIELELRIKRDEAVLEEKRLRKTYGAALGKEWDAFISHASEDKDFVRPLAKELEKSGLRVWFDETALKVGDRLRQKIDEGLAKSRYGIVVLSKKFFEKKWPQDELDGLVAREVAGVKVILPVWYDITREEVTASSPLLAGRLAARSSDGLPKIVEQLRDAMGLA